MFSLFEAALYLGALGPDGADPLAELVLGPAFFGGQVQEVVFLAIKPVQLVGEVAPHLLGQAEHVIHGGVDPAAQLVADLGGQPDVGGVVVGDRVLEYLDGHVGQVAAVLLLAAAEEVEVLAAVALGSLEGQPTPAAGAPEQPFQVVLVGAVAGAGSGVGVEYSLYSVEQVSRHQRLVPAGVPDALVEDLAEVVAVPERLSERRLGDGPAAPPGIRRHGQPGLGQLVTEFVDGVAGGGEQLEGHRDVLGSLRIERDGVDPVPLNVLSFVDVAELGLAEGAAVSGLVAHLEGDVLPVEPDLDLVEDVGDAFHGIGPDALAEVLLGGDQLDAELLQLPLDDDGIGEVTEGPGALVDDDVPDVALEHDPLQHLPELRPLADGQRRVARLDVFADVDRAKGSLLGGGYLALGID